MVSLANYHTGGQGFNSVLVRAPVRPVKRATPFRKKCFTISFYYFYLLVLILLGAISNCQTIFIFLSLVFYFASVLYTFFLLYSLFFILCLLSFVSHCLISMHFLTYNILLPYFLFYLRCAFSTLIGLLFLYYLYSTPLFFIINLPIWLIFVFYLLSVPKSRSACFFIFALFYI